MAVSPKVRDEMLTLGSSEHILAVARRVHPTWITAHGNLGDRGVEHLAREIGQCVAAFHHLQDEGVDFTHWFVIGPGFVVVRGPGIEGFSVAVVAGEVFDLHLAVENIDTHEVTDPAEQPPSQPPLQSPLPEDWQRGDVVQDDTSNLFCYHNLHGWFGLASNQTSARGPYRRDELADPLMLLVRGGRAVVS